jgi:hypothetical protein
MRCKSGASHCKAWKLDRTAFARVDLTGKFIHVNNNSGKDDVRRDGNLPQMSWTSSNINSCINSFEITVWEGW